VQQVRERASLTAQQFAMPRIADLYLDDFEEVARL
jgi:hypothetical protein